MTQRPSPPALEAGGHNAESLYTNTVMCNVCIGALGVVVNRRR